jgi:TetR/AcrR family transcriptional repressor of nem operon
MDSKHSDTRQHILDCGQQLIAAKGFAGVGLSEILSNAEVPKGSFYHYFGSKEHYGNILLESYFTSYLARLNAILEQWDINGAARLTFYLQRWRENQCCDDAREKCLIVKLAAEISDLSEAMRTTMRQGTDSILERLAGCIEAGQADGSIGTTWSPDKAALWLYETWLGASLLAKLRRDDSPLEAAMQATREIFHLK